MKVDPSLKKAASDKHNKKMKQLEKRLMGIVNAFKNFSGPQYPSEVKKKKTGGKITKKKK